MFLAVLPPTVVSFSSNDINLKFVTLFFENPTFVILEVLSGNLKNWAGMLNTQITFFICTFIL